MDIAEVEGGIEREWIVGNLSGESIIGAGGLPLSKNMLFWICKPVISRIGAFHSDSMGPMDGEAPILVSSMSWTTSISQKISPFGSNQKHNRKSPSKVNTGQQNAPSLLLLANNSLFH